MRIQVINVACVVALAGCMMGGGGGKAQAPTGAGRHHYTKSVYMLDYDAAVRWVGDGDYRQALEYLEHEQKEIDAVLPGDRETTVFLVNKAHESLEYAEAQQRVKKLRDEVTSKLDVAAVVPIGKSDAAVKLDYAVGDMQKGEAAGRDSVAAYRSYALAELKATSGLSDARSEKREWDAHTRLQTRTQGVLGPDELVSALTKVRDDAIAREKPLEATVLGAWARKYGKLSDDQRHMLVTAGEPESIDRKKCWVYRGSKDATCWDGHGRKKENAPPRTARRGGGGGGGGEAQGGGEAEPSCLKAELENTTDNEVHVNACGQSGPLNSHTQEDIEPNCPLEVEGHKATPKPCQHCTYDGSLHCE